MSPKFQEIIPSMKPSIFKRDNAEDPMEKIELITRDQGSQTESVIIFPSDYVEVEQIPTCVCSSCCLVRRKNDPLYIPELDPWTG